MKVKRNRISESRNERSKVIAQPLLADSLEGVDSPIVDCFRKRHCVQSVRIDAQCYRCHRGCAKEKVLTSDQGEVEDMAIESSKKEIILNALHTNKWNKSNTAKYLGISRKYLYVLLDKYGISADIHVSH